MRRLLKRGIVATGLAALLIGAAVAVAVEKEKISSLEPAHAKNAENEHVTYLGVSVEPMYPSLASHVPELLDTGQGVVVIAVATGSPADKAGILPHDVLMTYGDQKLFSPEQLAKLVRADKTGGQVAMSIVRNGKVEQVTATLGEHKVGTEGPVTPYRPNPGWWGWALPEWQSPHWRIPQRLAPSTTPDEKAPHWQTFDSMTIKKLGDDHFKAEIRYLDKEGKMHRQEFDGTREEVQTAIVAQKDLPDSEREHLLRSLDMPSSELEIPMFGVPSYGFAWNFGDLDWSL